MASSTASTISCLVALGLMLLCVCLQVVFAEDKGDKIIILPNKQHYDYGHKESYIPYPMYIPYGGHEYGGHSMGGYGGYGHSMGGYGGYGEMMHGY